MAEAYRIHPLADRLFAGRGASLRPCPPAERISLRATDDSLAGIGAALGLDLPARPKASASANGVTALWLGPDEWLLIGPEGSGLAGRLAGFNSAVASVVEISHRNTAFTIEGANAEAVLAAGCPQDLSLLKFPVGACSRTILAKAEIVLLREAADRFRVEGWRSFSEYVWNYCVDSAKSA